MNILIVGIGSIGTRYFKILKKLGNYNIFALRSGKGNNYHKERHKGLSSIYCFDEINNKNIERVLITNPTNLHLNTMKKCMKYKCPIFIEKPLADNLNSIYSYYNIINEYKPKITVGYVLRFHNLFIKLKELLQNKVIGNIVLSNMKVGHYLKYWHEYEDYRKVYYSQKKLGGGAIRTLSHEIDLCLFLFKKPDNVFGVVKKISNLEIDVDDYAMINMEIGNMVVNIEMNYLEPELIRKGEILGTEGKITYDFVEGIIKLTKYGIENETVFKYKGKEYDLMYERQMDYFLNNTNYTKTGDIYSGITVMEVIDAAEKSNKTGKRVDING
ncbi:hypothetical protein GM661_18105 [Iocasia frigidifontis]|uniref:Oxidoreductase n=1 Tax=Iocasia fonsfrigidae TaxID=2682810 RepID=A0A8A7KEP4_9FIRM|nr:Gfo/Idh/MocA family oxidoreductase [Iocasia fonsfrigidae]QTL99730.1 hypothetical protein GM661_18105 [Iocasia fonsfrigidae]